MNDKLPETVTGTDGTVYSDFEAAPLVGPEDDPRIPAHWVSITMYWDDDTTADQVQKILEYWQDQLGSVPGLYPQIHSWEVH